MVLTLRLFVLCAAASAAVGATVPQSGASLPVVYPKSGSMQAAVKEKGLYSEAVQVEPQRKGLLRGRKSLLSALGLLVGVASVTVLSFLLWKCFVEVRKRGGLGFWHRRLAEESGEGGNNECQKADSTEGTGKGLPEGSQERSGGESKEESGEGSGEESQGEAGEDSGEESLDESEEGSGEDSQDSPSGESGEESQDESEDGAEGAKGRQHGAEEESEEEELQYNPRLFEPLEESVIEWQNRKISKAQKELEKRKEKLASGDQMTLDLKKYVDRLQRFFEEMCEVSQREADLRQKFFSLKARVKQEGHLEEMLEQTRNELRCTQHRSTDALSRLRKAVDDIRDEENRWCKNHGLLPLHERDPGFASWSEWRAENISFEDSETKRRRKALERGKEVYVSSEPLNKKRIEKLEAARLEYQAFLQVQQEYFQKKQQAEENPKQADLQQAFQDVRRRLYDAHARASNAFTELRVAARELVNYEHSWSVAHGGRPPRNPYIVPFSGD